MIPFEKSVLKNTYLHMEGLSKAYEKKIWKSGIVSWEDAAGRLCDLPLPCSKKTHLAAGIDLSLDRMDAGDYLYFARNMPSNEHWRAYPEFSDDAAFVDIETTGLGWDSRITVIGIYDRKEARTFVRGIDLEDAAEALSSYKMLITYNGACFDLPFIEKEFPGLSFKETHFHIDLRYPLSRIGLKGGLKLIEQSLGIVRPDGVAGIDGFEAVRLWNRYERRKDQNALQTLLAYNREDIVNLETIIDQVYPRFVADCFEKALEDKG